jgi:hypothetical protein
MKQAKIQSGLQWAAFRTMRNVLHEDFPAEVRRMYKDAGIDISPDKSRSIAAQIEKQSRDRERELQQARAEGRPTKELDKIRATIWVKRVGRYIRGFTRVDKGEIASKHPDSYRNAFSIPPCDRQAFRKELMRQEDIRREKQKGEPLTDEERCKPEDLDRIMKRGLRKDGFFSCDRERGLYWTSNLELTELSAFKSPHQRSLGRLTPKQREHWQRFDRTPGLKHEYRSTDSDFIRWVISEAAKRGETIDGAEALSRYDAARKNCSRVESDKPLYTKNGRLYGRNLYIPNSWLNMPELNYNQFKVWADSLAIDGADTDQLLQQSIDCCDVVVVEIGIDPFTGERAVHYVGLETLIESSFIKSANDRREEWLRAEEERKELERKRKADEREARERAQRELEECLQREREQRIAEAKLEEARTRKNRKDHLTSLAVSQVSNPSSGAAKRIATMPFKECEEGGSGSIAIALCSHGVTFIEEVGGEIETFDIKGAHLFNVADAAIEAGVIVYSYNFAGTGRDGYHGRDYTPERLKEQCEIKKERPLYEEGSAELSVVSKRDYFAEFINKEESWSSEKKYTRDCDDDYEGEWS